MSDIIGKRFRRNKYGLSLWEDHVAEIIYERSYQEALKREKWYPELIERIKKRKSSSFRLVPKVLGKNTLKAYDFDEIIFYND